MSNTQETAVKNTLNMKTRRKGVKDAVIMREVILASKVNENGEITGTLETVAETCGMTKGALSGRLTQMRKAGIPIPELGRCPSSGKVKKKNSSDMMALFTAISDELDGELDGEVEDTNTSEG